MEYEAFMDLVRRRRSHWHFRSDPVPDTLVEQIVDAARYAPSAFDSQPWEFVVLKEQGLRDGVVDIIGAGMASRPWTTLSGVESKAAKEQAVPVKDPLGFKEAPVFIVVLGDTRVRAFAPPHLREDDQAWHTSLAVSLAAAYEHMHLAATALGLATRWVSAVSRRETEPKIKRFLGLIEEMMVFEMMAVGYSDFRPLSKRLRPLSEVMHVGVCEPGDFRSEVEVSEYFDKRR